MGSPTCEHHQAVGQGHQLLYSKPARKLPHVPWLSGRKPALKKENLSSTVDVLITDGALFARSGDFLFGFYFRAV